MPRRAKAGFPTYWSEFGQGARRALAIHCSLASSGSWGALARYISGALTMTAFDLPGHGRSGDWDDRGEIQEVTAEIAAAFLAGPTDVIGHSFGATVALRLAVERPALVRSLILIEPVFFAVAFADNPQIRAHYEASMKDYAQAVKANDREAAVRAFTAVWGDGQPWEVVPKEQQVALAERIEVVEAADAALLDDAGGMLKPGILESVDIPTLLIEGSKSPGIIAEINEGLAARLPRAERAVIVGAAHMAPVTHPAQVGAEVLRFLQGV